MRARLVRWFFFSILFGLVPLIAAYCKAQSVGPSVSIKELVARGGLLIVAAGLSAAAIGELMVSGREWESLKYSAGGACLLVVAAASLYYPVVSDAYTLSLANQQSLEGNLAVDFAFWFSVVVYVAAIYGSLVSVWVAERERRT